MAAADYPGGLRPHPPGLRPGPGPPQRCPAREMPEGCRAGLSSPAA